MEERSSTPQPGRRRTRACSPLDRTRPLPFTLALAERLAAKVDRSGGADACWPFTGKGQNGGYGVLTVGAAPYRTIYTHRLAYMAAYGIDPVGKAVCHRCDNPPCCNPAHLFLGSIADNVRDMIAKGRGCMGRNSRPPLLRGERASGAKVTEAAVREIRRRAAGGESSTVLGRAFGLDGSSVRMIVRRATWAHVA